jgi:16S rRNA (guanine527-N7)-methyltransferase
MLENILRAGFRELELPLDETALRRYRIYYENLEQTNRVMNLTAITGEEDAARLHFLDCAALLKLADLRGKTLEEALREPTIVRFSGGKPER